MKTLSKTYETISYTRRTRRTIESIECDWCHRKIAKTEFPEGQSQYFEVEVGNDLYYVKAIDICPSCLFEFLKKQVECFYNENNFFTVTTHYLTEGRCEEKEETDDDE